MYIHVCVLVCVCVRVCGIPCVLSSTRPWSTTRMGAEQVPLILPGILYDTELTVRSIDPTGAADQLEIFVCNPKSTVPAISAILKMPVSEIADA
jgi:hypothetical protein